MNRIQLTPLSAWALLLFSSPLARAQEKVELPPVQGEDETPGETQGETQDDPQRPRLQEIRPQLGGSPGGDMQQEIRDLFVRVERNLLRMEDYLLDASAGDTKALKHVDASGIDELLEQADAGTPTQGVAGMLGRSKRHGRQVLDDIDRIIEIANEQGGSCSQPSSGEPSPLEGNEPGSTDRTQGQSKPSEPKESKSSTGEEPSGNQDSPAPPKTSAADKSPDQATAPAPPPGQDAERWGELPIYTRELFRAGGGRDLPPQYRDWIDAYYRRLNRRTDG
jgi:hypothetical protein